VKTAAVRKSRIGLPAATERAPIAVRRGRIVLFRYRAAAKLMQKIHRLTDN
jgi:hypothetical protein